MKRISTLMCTAAAAVVAMPALAQTAPTQAAPAPQADAAGEQNSGADIIVTAQRQSQSIQSVPISVTVVGSDQLQRAGIQSVQDLSKASASLEFTNPDSSPGGGGFIRGIGTQTRGSPTATGSVGVVVDGVVQGNIPIKDLLDTDHVEVLKGPQGTLFGSSVTAGVLNITTHAPKIGEFSAHLEGEFADGFFGSQYRRYKLAGTVNMPVSANSALRLSVQQFDNTGQSHDTATGADSELRSFGVRARYLVELGDKVTVNLAGDYNDTHDQWGSGLVYRYVPANTPLAAAMAGCGLVASPKNVDNCSDVGRDGTTKSGGLSGQVDVDLGGPTLTSITSWRKSTNSSFNDILGISQDVALSTLGTGCQNNSPYNAPLPSAERCKALVFLHPGTKPDHPQVQSLSEFSQELRLTSDHGARLEWVAGLYFARNHFNQVQPSQLGLAIPAPVCTNVLGKQDLGNGVCLFNDATNLTDGTSKEYAAFGNATFHISDATRLIAGLRYTHSSISETSAQPSTVPSVTLGVKDNAVTGRLGIQHNFGRDTMTYATVSTGYKPPQINDQTQALAGIKAERPTSFEVGIKQSLFDRKLAINADVFYTHVRNFQSLSCIANDVTGTIQCANINVPKVNTKGIEADIFGQPFPGTSISLSGIYNIAKYPTGFTGADGTDLSGHQLNYAPKYKITASIEQEAHLSSQFMLAGGVDVTIRGKQAMYLSADPAYVVPAVTLLGAHITLKNEAGWSLTLFGRNLTNKIYPTSLFPTTAFFPASPTNGTEPGIWQNLDASSQRVVGLQFSANL